MKKIKFYLFGLVPGLVIMMFFLNQKGASCSGYLPNDRVLQETASKKIILNTPFSEALKTERLSENFVKDSILTNSEIDFDKSHAQAKPCPDYTVFYPKKNPRYEVKFTKCKDVATFSYFRNLRTGK